MAAGLGFIEFTTGDVLSASAANGYLASQTVMVFATAAARTAAITSPQEGMFSFLKDSDTTQFYTGAAWANVDTGASPLTTKGDIYGFSTVNARLAVGANNTLLTADSTQATGLRWATPAAAGLTFITSAAPSATGTVNFDNCFSTTYQNYQVHFNTSGSTGSGLNIRLRVATVNTTTNYFVQTLQATGVAVNSSRDTAAVGFIIGAIRATGRSYGIVNISNPFTAAETSYTSSTQDPNSSAVIDLRSGSNTLATSFDGLSFFSDSGNFTGSIRIYGVANS